MSSCRFHVFVSVSCLRVVSYPRVGLCMSSRGFMSSCCCQIFTSFHIFVLFSDPHFALVSSVFPPNFFHSSPTLFCRGSLFNAEHVAVKQQHARPSGFSFSHVFACAVGKPLQKRVLFFSDPAW